MSIRVDPNRVVRICDAALLMLDEMADDIEAFCLEKEADYAARQAKADEEYKAGCAKAEAELAEYKRAMFRWEGRSIWYCGAPPTLPYLIWPQRHSVRNDSPRWHIHALRQRIECMRSLARMSVGYFDVDEAKATELDQWEHGKHAEQVRSWITPKVEA